MGSKFFQDDCGNESMMRVLSFVFMIFCIVMVSYILAIWGYIACITKTFPPLAMTDLFGVFGGIGALCFKAFQKKFEVTECESGKSGG